MNVLKLFVSLTFCLPFALNAQSSTDNVLSAPQGVEGFCNASSIYLVYNNNQGDSESVGPMDNEELLQLWGSTSSFLKENKGKDGFGTVRIFVNCKGKVVHTEMLRSTGYAEFDREIHNFFLQVGDCKPAYKNWQAVDSYLHINFGFDEGKVFQQY
jgi:hypothetical protein